MNLAELMMQSVFPDKMFSQISCRDAVMFSDSASHWGRRTVCSSADKYIPDILMLPRCIGIVGSTDNMHDYHTSLQWEPLIY